MTTGAGEGRLDPVVTEDEPTQIERTSFGIPDAALSVIGPIPDKLYHYTTAPGLQGIIESGSLWATDLAYLNDSLELRYGLQFYKSALMRETKDFLASEAFVNLALDDSQLFRERRLFVTCYCEEGDLLSQWRGYGGVGGYSIGFNSAAMVSLKETNRRFSLPYFPVFYGDDIAERMAREWASMTYKSLGPLLASFEAMHMEQAESEELIEHIAKTMFEFKVGEFVRASRGCAYLKHAAFREEHEWRSVGIFSARHGRSSFRFRQGPIGLTPYTVLNLAGDDGLMPIDKIIVGPGSNMDLRIEAVKLLLATHGYRHEIPVVPSEAPFRAS